MKKHHHSPRPAAPRHNTPRVGFRAMVSSERETLPARAAAQSPRNAVRHAPCSSVAAAVHTNPSCNLYFVYLYITQAQACQAKSRRRLCNHLVRRMRKSLRELLHPEGFAAIRWKKVFLGFALAETRRCGSDYEKIIGAMMLAKAIDAMETVVKPPTSILGRTYPRATMRSSSVPSIVATASSDSSIVGG